MTTTTLRIVPRTDDPFSGSTGNTGFPIPRFTDNPADRHGTYSEHYDIQFVVGMLLLLRGMVKGLDKRRVRALLQRASGLEDLHGRFVRHRSGYVVFQPDDGPELMLQDDIQHSLELRGG
ncbi:MAG TPA: hypothetical protein VKG92_07355 [Flavobacteriales bacterium]|nr:hypothetical protein [Flavobacteriales bacterium]